MLLRAIARSSSKIYTTRTATSSLYRCSSLRTFCGAVENDKSSKETSDLKSANANKAIARKLAGDIERVIRDLSARETKLSQSKARLDEAIESSDTEQIFAAINDVRDRLATEYKSVMKKGHSLPTQLTAIILQRFGGKPSAMMGRCLRVYQMEMLNYQVNPHDVSDHAAHLTLARAFVATLVLGLFIYL